MEVAAVKADPTATVGTAVGGGRVAAGEGTRHGEWNGIMWSGGMRPRLLRVFGAALLAAMASTANAEPADDIVDALGIREYLSATESECRVAARDQARRQVRAALDTRFADRRLSPDTDARLENLYRGYAREACRLGVEDGILQRYRAVYADALSSEDREAALAFLLSAPGQNFVRAGLAANRAVLPTIRRRQQSQASRAAALLQTRLASLIADLSRNGTGADRGGAKAR